MSPACSETLSCSFDRNASWFTASFSQHDLILKLPTNSLGPRSKMSTQMIHNELVHALAAQRYTQTELLPLNLLYKGYTCHYVHTLPTRDRQREAPSHNVVWSCLTWQPRCHRGPKSSWWSAPGSCLRQDINEGTGVECWGNCTIGAIYWVSYQLSMDIQPGWTKPTRPAWSLG